MRILRRRTAPEVESYIALEKASESLNEVKKRSNEVDRVEKTLKDLRKRNRFSERLNTIMRGY